MSEKTFARRFHIEHDAENIERYKELLRLGETTKLADVPPRQAMVKIRSA